MARHIMAACVVCLLCADRIHCEQHYDGAYTASNNVESKTFNANVLQRINNENNAAEHNSKLRIYSTENLQQSSNINQRTTQHQRHKRHTGHVHGEEHIASPRPAITDNFLKRIFDEYGQGDGTLSISEFRSMLKQLGLHQLVEQKLAANSTAGQHHNVSSRGSCLADSNLIHHLQEQMNHYHKHVSSTQYHNHDHEVSRTINESDTASNCTQNATAPSDVYDASLPCDAPSDTEWRRLHTHLNLNYTLNDVDLLNVCPVLLYQLASPLETKRDGCIDEAVLIEIEERSHNSLQTTNKQDMVYVWIYAFISVFACGILGLVGVAIIPFMDSHYYKHIIQYLVSLAVGTMTGDALLHLLPHSLAGQSESGMIYKGLTCMVGILFFYLTEHGLTMISEWRKGKAKKDTKQARAKVVRDPDSSVTNSAAGDRLCKSKYSSYPYCYDEIAMDTRNDVWMHLPKNTTVTEAAVASSEIVPASNKRSGRAEAEQNEGTAAQSLLSSLHNHGADQHHHHHHHHHHLLNHQHNDLVEHQPLAESATVSHDANAAGSGNDNANASKEDNKNNDTVTVILREHESSHHGHSHKHGHVHSPPESLSAVAWMIIMGDGLHNFTDGMAIGAAFAENIAGGFSTSLAVFCHELPHELGDFAILMKAGMSVKSAVYYNLLTGVLSFIGMIFGIVFGQTQAAAQWMFAAAAGLFIYIALVDMMPELSAAHKSLEQLALQIFGMTTGVFIMLLIAIFEHDLMDVFSSSSVTATSSSFVPAPEH